MGGASRTHRRARWLAVVAFLGALVLALPTASALEPTKLDASAVVSDAGTKMSVSGRLVSGEVGVDSAAVDVQLAGTRMGTAPTDREGNFRLTFVVPAESQGGVRAVDVAFAGDDRFAATRHSTEVAMTDAPVAPPPAPEPVRSATSLSLMVTPEDPRPGELLTLTGALRVGEDGVEGRRLHFTLGGRASRDSVTYTTGSGGFTTYLEIPVDQAPGRLEVQAIFDATSTLAEASRNIPITVRDALPTPSEQPTHDEVAAAAPTITAPATVEPEPTPEEVRETPTVTAPVQEGSVTDPGTTEATPPTTGGPLTAFLVTLVVVGGSALLVSIVLVLRKVTRSERLTPDDDASAFLITGVDMWADPDSDDWPDEDDPEDPDAEGGPDDPDQDRWSSRADDGYMAGIHRDEPVAQQPKPRRAWSGEG